MVTRAATVPGLASVRNSLNPVSDVPSAKRWVVDGVTWPKASWPSVVSPAPKSWAKYMGRSATIGGPDWTARRTPRPTHQTPPAPSGAGGAPTRAGSPAARGTPPRLGPGAGAAHRAGAAGERAR